MNINAQNLNDYMKPNIVKEVLKISLMNILENEMMRDEALMNTKKIRQTVKALDKLDGIDIIPVEFSIENFIKRFNSHHHIDLKTN